MTVLVLLAYFQRPRMVRNALRQLRTGHELYHQDWRLGAIDDGSRDELWPIIVEELGDELARDHDRVHCYRIEETGQEKLDRGGSCHGYYMNKAIREIPSDLVLVNCDDDAIVPFHLQKLSHWYEVNPDVQSSWSYAVPFDPHAEIPENVPLTRWGGWHLNYRPSVPIPPSCRLDASQVTWRTKVHTDHEIWWPERCPAGLDSIMFNSITVKTGLTYPNGLIGQYKGVHRTQLGRQGLTAALSSDLDIQ